MRKLFPKARDYLDTYETFGLLGEKGFYGHMIHLEAREIDRLSEVGASPYTVPHQIPLLVLDCLTWKI